MVAEMAAILLFDIANGETIRLMDQNVQQSFFGRSFEELGQSRRVQVLRAFGLISDELESHFDSVRRIRNKYLHLYSKDEPTTARDAVDAYLSAVTIVVKVIGLGFGPKGEIIMRSELLRYMERLGIAKSPHHHSNEQGHENKNEKDSTTA
jgi:hypothetical protein